MKPYKITIETPNGKKFTAEIPWDADVEEMVQAFGGLMVSCTYPYETVEPLINATWFDSAVDA